MTAAHADAPDPPLARFRAWAAEAFKPNWPQALFAAKFVLVVAISLYVAFAIDLPRTYWSLFTVPFVVQQNTGLTVWRCINRSVGTIIGAIIGLVFVGCFGQVAATTIIAMSLWIFAVAFMTRFFIGQDTYGYATAGLTALVVVLDTGPMVDMAYATTLERATETLIPILVAFVVMPIVFPVSISDNLRTGVLDARRNILALARRAASLDRKPGVQDHQKAVQAMAALHVTLRTRKFESAQRIPRLRQFSYFAIRLNAVLMDSAAISTAVDAYRKAPPPPSVDQALADLDQLMQVIPPEPLVDADIDKRIDAHAEAFRQLDRRISNRTLAGEGLPDSAEATALYAIQRFARAMSGMLDAEAAFFDLSRPVPPLRPVVMRNPDWVAAFERGLRPVIIFVSLAMLWLFSASSNIQTLALIGGSVSLAVPALAPRLSQPVFGKLFAIGIAAMFLPLLCLMIVMPYVETYLSFILLLGSVIFVMVYVCSEPGQVVFVIGGMILIAIALNPQNQQTYSAVSAFNVAATFAFLPLVLGTAFAVIFPENHAWLLRHLHRQSRSVLGRAARARDTDADKYLAQSTDLIADFGGDLDPDDPATDPALRRSRVMVMAGFELYDLNALARAGDLPQSLAAMLPDLGAEICEAADARNADPADHTATLDRAIAEARRLIAHPDASDAGTETTLRFLYGTEFLRTLVSRDLLGKCPRDAAA